MQRVLFVCLGNICRSPTAEAVFRRLVEKEGLADRFVIDSAGTAAYHVGEPPDPRAQRAGRRRGYNLAPLRARQIEPADFRRFDWVLAMDRSNRERLDALAARSGGGAQVRLLLDFAPELSVREVPDPYYREDGGFDEVLDIVEAGARGFLEHLRAAFDPAPAERKLR